MKKALLLLPLTFLLVACGQDTQKVEFKLGDKTVTRRDLVNDLKTKFTGKDVEEMVITKIALSKFATNEEVIKKAKEVIEEYKKNEPEKLKELMELRGDKDEQEFIDKFLLPKTALDFLEREFLENVYVKPENYTSITVMDFDDEEKAKKHLSEVEKFISENQGKGAEELKKEVVEKFFEKRTPIPIRKDVGLDENIFQESRKQSGDGGFVLSKIYKVKDRYLVIYSDFNKDKIKEQAMKIEKNPVAKSYTGEFLKYHIQKEGKLKTDDPLLKSAVEEYNKVHFEKEKK